MRQTDKGASHRVKECLSLIEDMSSVVCIVSREYCLSVTMSMADLR